MPFDDAIYSVNNLVINFTQPSKDVSFYWGFDGAYNSGTIEIYNEADQLVNSIPVTLSGYWTNFSLNQFNQRIKKVILRRPNVSNNVYGHIPLDNFQFTPISDVQSVVFEPVNNEVININGNGVLTNSSIDRPSYGDSSQRIFPERITPSDTINRKTVRVKAIVGKPGVTVYFKNFDVDDPSADSAIDENGSLGCDNRDGRTIGQPCPPAAAGVLSASSATTNPNGEAIVYFTVTKQPGDNFVVAASTDPTYIGGVGVNGTGLKDSSNVSLPTGQAKRTELLTVWRKVHIEVDSMGQVSNNFLTGVFMGKTTTIGTTPTWIDIYPTSFTPILQGYWDDHSFQETIASDGVTRLSYGGRMDIAGVHNLAVLDNSWYRRDDGVPFATTLKVVSLSGNVNLYHNTPFKIYDDDDFNENDGISLKKGDNGENVDAVSSTFSKLQVSDDPSQNPYASAYIIPERNWAEAQGLNNTNLPFELFSECSLPKCPEQRDQITLNQGSKTMESDDFWVAYALISYQADEFRDMDRRGYLLGIAPYRTDHPLENIDYYNVSPGVPPGGIGAVIFLENMRDREITPYSTDESVIASPRSRTLAHEIGHQFGLGHNDNFIGDGGIMSYTGSLYFSPNHINMMRWRIKSPGEGN